MIRWLFLVFIIATIIAAMGHDLPCLGSDTHPSSWRTEEFGGVTALYCYLRIWGHPCDYSSMVKEFASMTDGKCTVLDISRLAAANGMNLQPRLLKYHELSSSPLPVIVHMDGESPELGAFLMLTGISERQILYVNGPTATVHSMSPEDFLRVWSGAALLQVRSTDERISLWACGFVAGMGVTGAIFIVRRLSRRRKPKIDS